MSLDHRRPARPAAGRRPVDLEDARPFGRRDDEPARSASDRPPDRSRCSSIRRRRGARRCWPISASSDCHSGLRAGSAIRSNTAVAGASIRIVVEVAHRSPDSPAGNATVRSSRAIVRRRRPGSAASRSGPERRSAPAGDGPPSRPPRRAGSRRPAGRTSPGRGRRGRRPSGTGSRATGTRSPRRRAMPSASGPPAWAHWAWTARILALADDRSSLIPALSLVGPPSGMSGEAAEVERDPFRARRRATHGG